MWGAAFRRLPFVRKGLARLPRWARWAAVIALAGAIPAAVRLVPSRFDAASRRALTPRRQIDGDKDRHSSPARSGELAPVRVAAERFLKGYLGCAYGKRSAPTESAITPSLRRRLRCEGMQVTPADRRRRPRALSLQLSRAAPGVAIATATIDDGGLTVYALRFTLAKRSRAWFVTSVSAG